jgi:hypothetical protein
MKAITELAQECARLCWDQRTINSEGETIYSKKPLPGDWEALEGLLGREPTQDEAMAFNRFYRPGEAT